VFLEKIKLQNFRSYSVLNLAFQPGLHIFFGKNGAGKTSLLESIFYVTQGRSFRTHQTQTALKSGESFFRVQAQLNGEHLLQNEVIYQDEKLKLNQNNKPTTSRKMAIQSPSILFSPQSLDFVQGGPEPRRELLDEIVLTRSPSELMTFADLERVLRQRSLTLRKLKKGEISPKAAEGLLIGLNPLLFDLTLAIVELRIKALSEILPLFRESARQMNLGSGVDISVEYVISEQEVLTWSPENRKKHLSNRLLELADAEMSAGANLFGPQRHDFRFKWAGYEARHFCSQGESRGLILALKMAQIVYHQKVRKTRPILLLDDVMSELDSERREALRGLLATGEFQIFLTTTEFEKSGFESIHQNVWHVDGGQIVKVAKILN